MKDKIKHSCTCKENSNHTNDGKLHNGFYELNHQTICKKCNGILRPPFSL